MADQMDEDQRQRGHHEEWLRTKTEELEKARAQIGGLEEVLTKAKEYVAIMANMGQNTSTNTEPVAAANV